MKKQLLLLCFACFLFAGSQLSFAQTTTKKQNTVITNSDYSAEKSAQKVINLLEREAKLDATQKEKLHDVFTAVEKKMNGIASIEDATERQAKKKKMRAYIDKKLQQIFTPAQYDIYKKKTAAK
ncbi:hypothetical protein [Psychroserpens luteolus]|uniref:hypothetical protein n=1 Tax=Psychroserpens luteolus TaxID=2855840 RepID=UPI001E3F5A20|nr:hypothetical protein [Psychroserpens luteolus]MCD2260673.1 hypothetical protein [Psychroserpens luteolus]